MLVHFASTRITGTFFAGHRVALQSPGAARARMARARVGPFMTSGTSSREPVTGGSGNRRSAYLYGCALAATALISCFHPAVHADDFDRECNADSDCMLIEVGNKCDCTCERIAAINKADREKYERAHARAFDPDLSSTCGRNCGPCASVEAVAVCQTGRCGWRPRHGGSAAVPAERF